MWSSLVHLSQRGDTQSAVSSPSGSSVAAGSGGSQLAAKPGRTKFSQEQLFLTYVSSHINLEHVSCNVVFTLLCFLTAFFFFYQFLCLLPAKAVTDALFCSWSSYRRQYLPHLRCKLMSSHCRVVNRRQGKGASRLPWKPCLPACFVWVTGGRCDRVRALCEWTSCELDKL